MAAKSFLAFDLGASNGRAMLGRLEGGRLELRELHRFANDWVDLNGRLHWDVAYLLQQIKAGMRACSAEGVVPESVAVDTWGVDFGLLDRDGALVGLPYCYRDLRVEGAAEEFFGRVPRARVYDLTGIQFMPINSLFQLFASVRSRSPLLDAAHDLLFMPDLFSYFLSGRKSTEFTIATTSQLYNPRRGGWEPELFAALGVSADIMQPVSPPGTTVGPLRPAVTQEVGLPEVPVVATASHDTGAAVAAAPAEGADWAYISSGTWSLMGVESAAPLISPRTAALNLTNEGGVGGTFRVLKNIAGMWLLQQCRRSWDPQGRTGYGELVAAAAEAPPFEAVICPDAAGFANPPDMPEAIESLCNRTGQRPLATRAGVVRAILEGLALRYRMVLAELREVYPCPINRVHIIGGGSQNALLCQFAADAMGVPVIAGPVEATAAGNVMVQAMAAGQVRSPAEIRQTVRQSFPTVAYQPRPEGGWDRAYARFAELMAQVA
jgi:rhamnulokinase